MASTVQDMMSTDLVTCPSTATITEAAQLMHDRDIGDVLVTRDGDRIAGIVTDRDLVVRCLADGAAADATVDFACSDELTTLPVTGTPDEAVRLMRERSLRRLPVVDGGRVVGIVSLGDLAIARDLEVGASSALGDISAAEPNN